MCTAVKKPTGRKQGECSAYIPSTVGLSLGQPLRLSLGSRMGVHHLHTVCRMRTSNSTKTSNQGRGFGRSQKTAGRQSRTREATDTVENQDLELNGKIVDGIGAGVAGDRGGRESGEETVTATASVAQEEVAQPPAPEDTGISVDDLMAMIRDAEKNILMLNRVRVRAVEEREQIRAENQMLQGQAKVLTARLAEAEAKAKLTSQLKAKNQLLEEQLSSLQAKLEASVNGSSGITLEAIRTDNEALVDQNTKLQAKVRELKEFVQQLNQAESTNSSLREQLEMMRAQLAEAQLKEKLSSEAKSQSEVLQEQVGQLQARGMESDMKIRTLEQALVQSREAEDEVRALRIALLDSKKTVAKTADELEKVQEQLQLATASLAEKEAERELWSRVQAENEVLRDQVDMLKDRLRDVDIELRDQLERYKAEVAYFQESMEDLRSTSVDVDGKVPVGEMPWDFWSNLLLRIDALALSELITADEGIELRMLAWERDLRIRDAFLAVQEEADNQVANSLRSLLKSKQRPGMHIIHIAAEMAPVAKVGGLADVVTGLGRALQKKGHLVEFILPKYDCMDYSRIKGLKVMDFDLFSYFNGEAFKNKVWRGVVEGLPVYFIEPLHPGRFFWRRSYYGCHDDFERFTYFCRAALEFLLKTNKRPDIVHCHDWQTAAVPPLYWDIYAPQGLNSAQVAFTCHNFEYQGAAPPASLNACGLHSHRYHRPDRMQDNFAPDRINLLKGGIVYSNIVTTVSPTYAQEVRGPEEGRGLHVTLGQHASKFYGVLNGIDNEVWCPSTDPLLEYQYSPDDLGGKFANKMALRARLGMSCTGADAEKPLVGCVTRLVPQKGVHLIQHAIYRTAELGGQFVLLGSSPVPHIQAQFEGVAREFENHPHVRLILKYDESLAHAIYGASDIFVIPSIFEPCGLTQLIAMRYGSVPVARKTGGLNDRYRILNLVQSGLNFALDRALGYFMESREWWTELVTKVMQMDFSWDKPCEEYIDLYQAALARRTVR
ncbi:hypothetical protein CBR_g53508 [Chara braunii]|uniref:starch synthase n=1 Tax=Chara braunii TaxID=69332 RepID=A0A388MAU2_CHABU|nr:hypothetical protein CBR_g53508 [Chara braunii]|eukprot:GBG91694.1 hypothetical protein CBR_g53508 [Chara braunii]